MKKSFIKRISLVLLSLAAAVLIPGCPPEGPGTSDDGSGSVVETTSYTIGGTVSGMTGTSMTLTLNGSENLIVTGNGSFVFSAKLSKGAAYAVTCSSAPNGQGVDIANSSGTVSSANVTNVTVSCYDAASRKYSVSADVSGLSEKGFQAALKVNGTVEDTKNITSNGALSFEAELSQGDDYQVVINIHPDDQYALVRSGRGTIDAADVSIDIDCQTPVEFPEITGTTTVGGGAEEVYEMTSSTSVDNFETLEIADGTVLLMEDGADLSVGTAGTLTIGENVVIGSTGSESASVIEVAGTATISSGAEILFANTGNSSRITVPDGGELTIEPGCYIELSDSGYISIAGDIEIGAGCEFVFGSGGYAEVTTTGSLNAIGLETSPIIFTGAQKTSGYWRGMQFYASNDTNNQLDWVTVEYGGGYDSTYWENAGINLYGSSSVPTRISIMNSTFRYCGNEIGSVGSGFYLNEYVNLSAFSNNIFTGNVGFAGRMELNQLGMIGNGNDFTGNGNANDGDYLLVYTYGHTITSPVTWKNIGVDYYMDYYDISVESELTIEAGTTVCFDSNIGMTIASGGSLSAVGTASEPIVFSGIEKSKGYWKGLAFNQSSSADNDLVYCTIEYAGNNNSNQWKNACLTMGGSSSDPIVIDRIENCILRESSNYGLWMGRNATINTFSSNTITACQSGPVYAYANLVRFLDADSSYTGNTDTGGNPVNKVTVYCYASADNGDINIAQTWHDLSDINGDAYYQTEYVDLEVNAALTLDPGVEIRFVENYGLQVTSSGSLYAVGTSEDHIKFTRVSGTSTYWEGIVFNQTDSDQNRLVYCDVEYGGSGTPAANITLGYSTASTTSVAEISNCRITNSDGYGIYMRGDELLDFSSNTISSNADAPVYVYANSVHWFDDSSTYTGNTNDYIDVVCSAADDGKIMDAQIWQAQDVFYRLDVESINYLEVNNTLTIMDGAELRFNNCGLYINTNGVLVAEGSSSNGIIFTSIDAVTKGSWRGISFCGSNSIYNKLDYCTVSCGGGASTQTHVTANITVEDWSSASRLAISNTELNNSSGYGISINNVSSVIINGTLGSALSASEWQSSLEGSGNSFSGNSEAVNLY